MGNDVVRPFRWDLTQRTSLGSLVDVDPPETPQTFIYDLGVSCARVIAAAGDSDIAFVGRSPESLFHFLSGALAETTWAERLSLLDLSVRGEPVTQRDARAVEPYFDELLLNPDGLIHRPRPVAFVDVVATGGTFARLVWLIADRAEREGADADAAFAKLRFVGLTSRTKTSPKTWRWQQHAEWVRVLGARNVKNVSLPPRFAAYLADEQPKMTLAFVPELWRDPAVRRPPRDLESRRALALALRIYETGRGKPARQWFARVLAAQPAMRERWFRALVHELKK